MCGIFGYYCKNPISMTKVLELLQKLEKHQFTGEENPVGGHGAGVCFLNDSGQMVIHKVGRETPKTSPVEDLSRIQEVVQAKSNIILGHVRRASNKFQKTVKYDVATQPYHVNCLGSYEIVSAHNGLVKNHKTIRGNLTENHQFESDKIGFIDSEVIPHLFEESLITHNDENEAREDTFKNLEGNNTVVLLSTTKNSRFLHVIQKGHTRGMHVWKNDKGEIILCSREEPLQEVFGDLMNKGNFKKDFTIEWEEDREVQRTYRIATHTHEAEEKLREVTIQTQITWAVLLLTCFVGLVELLPELKLYHDFLWFSSALIIMYLILAVGLSYSIIRFSTATLFVVEWRRLLPKDVREKVVYLSPLYEEILFDKKQKLRRWIVYLVSLLCFIFWCIILAGKILTSI